MKVTKLRHTDGSKLTSAELELLAERLLRRLESRGFITGTHVLTGTSIKIGLRMSSFRIDTSILGHNGRMGRYIDSPKGYKRTNVPTWDQRVQFNNEVNNLLDQFNYKANIKSGPFTVRTFVDGAMTESDWDDQTPSWQGSLLMSAIRTEKECRMKMNSDRREKEHAEKTKEARSLKSKQYRETMKAFLKAKKVVVAGFYSWNEKPTKNGKLMTHAAFNKMLGGLSAWEAKRVKKASIQATIAVETVGF